MAGVARKSLQCKNLHDYLKTLQSEVAALVHLTPPQVLDQLYNTPATCLAVFRELPALAKQLVTPFPRVQTHHCNIQSSGKMGILGIFFGQNCKATPNSEFLPEFGAQWRVRICPESPPSPRPCR